MDNMTIKELAKVAGVSDETIRRVTKKIFPGKIQNGVKTTFNKDECFDIMANTRRKNQLVETLPASQKSVEDVKVDYDAIGKMIGVAITAALSPVVNELKELKQLPALPAPIVEDKYSLAGYCQLKQIKVNRSELALHGRELRKISNREGLIIDKIPDERWGFVNSYPVKILDEYFAA